MCVVCFNSQWRSVLIGSSSAIISLFLILTTVVYKDDLSLLLDRKAELCDRIDDDKSCVFFIAAAALFPWTIWTLLALYLLLNGSLVVAALYGNLIFVTSYLAIDAAFLGILACSLCFSLFPSGLIRYILPLCSVSYIDYKMNFRVALLTILFPLFALALCAWMTVFGFYLRLEDRAKRKAKKKKAAESLIQNKSSSDHDNPKDEFTNIAIESET